MPESDQGLKLQVRVRYHILTDKAYKTLKTEYGMPGEHPYNFTIYERDLSLGGPLTADVIPLGRRQDADGAAACAKKG